MYRLVQYGVAHNIHAEENKLLRQMLAESKEEQKAGFATGMNGDEDLGQDIIMKGDKFHYAPNQTNVLQRHAKGIRSSRESKRSATLNVSAHLPIIRRRQTGGSRDIYAQMKDERQSMLRKRLEPEMTDEQRLEDVEIDGRPYKRHNTGHDEPQMPNMQTLRARDKRDIFRLLKENASLLKPFDDIVGAIISEAEDGELQPVKTRGLFTDGFSWNTNGIFNSGELEAYLKGYGLDVHCAWASKVKHQVFVMLNEEGHNLN